MSQLTPRSSTRPGRRTADPLDPSRPGPPSCPDHRADDRATSAPPLGERFARTELFFGTVL